MEEYFALHSAKSYAEWDDKDMEKAIYLLAHPVTDADRKELEEEEKLTLSQECSTGSCLIHQMEFTAAKKLREGSVKTVREAIDLKEQSAEVSVDQQQSESIDSSPTKQIISLSQLIEFMLNAARLNNLSKDFGEQSILNNLPRPERGDRKIARENNKSGIKSLNMGDYKTAVSFFAAGVAVDPADIELRNNQGYALMMNGQMDAAFVKLIDVLSFDVARSGAWANLGFVFAKQGNQENAVSAFKLSYYFSRFPENTISFFKTRSESDADDKIRNASAVAISDFANIQPLIKLLPH